MSKVPECDSCQFYSQNPHIICAIHPFGIDEDKCLDFRPDPNIQPSDEELWSPEGYSFYNGELIKNPQPKYTREQQLEILDFHPIFTGVCPRCSYKYPTDTKPKEYSMCPECGWVDDSLVN